MNHDDQVNDYYRGVFSERERIIALLETQDCHYSTYKKPCDCGAFMVEQIDYLVALIKGENSE